MHETESQVILNGSYNINFTMDLACKDLGFATQFGREFGVPLDPLTLACEREKGIRVRPEHIHQALREYAGIADHPLSKKFPLGVVEKERLRGLWG